MRQRNNVGSLPRETPITIAKAWQERVGCYLEVQIRAPLGTVGVIEMIKSEFCGLRLILKRLEYLVRR
jgi:hypothetical protein